MRKLFLIAIPVLFSTFVHAQGDQINFNFDHMALSVKDVNRSAEFYGKVLGLPEITNRSKLEGVRWFSIGNRELHLISIIKENITLNKAIHLALTTSSFDTFIKRLDEKKIAYSDWPGKAQTVNIRADGIKQVFFQDPDGYWIEVNSVAQK
jgi:catechol 2,3-dioxygenase-like lactoylglutathione lyase family enzyme